MKIYFANDLFSEATRSFNADVVKKIRANTYAEVFLPQEDEAINDKSNYADSIMIATADTKELMSSDMLIAVLDGLAIDPGVASEIGMFYTTGKPIIALYTDPRRVAYRNLEKQQATDIVGENQISYVNLYTVGLVKKRGLIVSNSDDLPWIINEYMDTGKLRKGESL